MVCYLKMCHKKWNLSCNLFTKQPFRLRHIKGLFEAFLKVITGISQEYIRNFSAFSCMNKACLRNILNISQAYLRYISGISRAYFWHLSGIMGLAHRFKFSLTNNKISVNSISFNPNYPGKLSKPFIQHFNWFCKLGLDVYIKG